MIGAGAIAPLCCVLERMAGVMTDDHKLDEVKTILRRLQRIGNGEEEAGDTAALEDRRAGQEGAARAWSGHGLKTPAGSTPTAPAMPQATGTELALSVPRAIDGRIAAAAAAVLLAAVGLAVLLWPDREPAPMTAAIPRPVERSTADAESGRPVAAPASDAQGSAVDNAGVAENAAARITGAGAKSQIAEPVPQAQRLIEEGKIVAGRELLLAGPAEQMADAALALARSYDPNSLRLIPNADASADPVEAERWYRRWHELAALQGVALDAPRLDRIIKAMK
jgi:hypothetical protein